MADIRYYINMSDKQKVLADRAEQMYDHMIGLCLSIMIQAEMTYRETVLGQTNSSGQPVLVGAKNVTYNMYKTTHLMIRLMMEDMTENKRQALIEKLRAAGIINLG
jgi:hypothetical protein